MVRDTEYHFLKKRNPSQTCGAGGTAHQSHSRSGQISADLPDRWRIQQEVLQHDGEDEARPERGTGNTCIEQCVNHRAGKRTAEPSSCSQALILPLRLRTPSLVEEKGNAPVWCWAQRQASWPDQGKRSATAWKVWLCILVAAVLCSRQSWRFAYLFSRLMSRCSSDGSIQIERTKRRAFILFL